MVQTSRRLPESCPEGLANQVAEAPGALDFPAAPSRRISGFGSETGCRNSAEPGLAM